MPGIQELCKGAGVKPDVVYDIFGEILRRVAAGEQVRVKGFGVFERKLYPGRTFSTPVVNDGDPIEYPDTFGMKFRQSQLAKRRLNSAKPAKSAEKKPAKKSKLKAKVKSIDGGSVHDHVMGAGKKKKKAKK